MPTHVSFVDPIVVLIKELERRVACTSKKGVLFGRRDGKGRKEFSSCNGAKF